MKTKTIDFRGYEWSYLPKLLWQALFDDYRDNGGDLSNLSNLLVDYENCKEVFDKLLSLEGQKAFTKNERVIKFLFGCCKDWRDTTWISEERIEPISTTMEYSVGEYFILCELTEDQATLTYLESENENATRN